MRQRQMKASRKPVERLKKLPLEGSYPSVENPDVRLILKRGRFQWGSSDIFNEGTYKVIRSGGRSVLLAFASGFYEERKHPDKYELTRRGVHYVLKELSERGWETAFTRADKKVFLADTPLKENGWPSGEGTKQIADSNAAVTFDLTGESVIRAAVIPSPPRFKAPTVVRVSHSNSYGPVDSDVYVRLGDPKRPLDVQDFDTVSDWRKAELIEDLTWSDTRRKWARRGTSKGVGSYWSGTYEVAVQFPRGRHQIELKIISRVPEVFSIVLSNWQVYVK
jgi:hypothetical protein